MPFVRFENAIGSGLVVPAADGGTEACYLRFKDKKAGLEIANGLRKLPNHFYDTRPVRPVSPDAGSS